MKLFFDVGGTELKVATFDEEGRQMEEIRHFDADSCAPCEQVFDNMANVIKQSAEGKTERITAIGMAFPGPFDYEKGICLIKGLGKYENIYNRSIPEEIGKRLPELSKVPFFFLHDVEAFALGAYYAGESRGAGKTMFVCIGTGTGTAFIKDGKVLKDCEDNSPKNGWIYEDRFKDGKIDEYISVRGLKRIAKEIAGKELTGLEIFEMCQRKDPTGFLIYESFGNEVAQALKKYILDFRPDRLVLGGQISKSFGYFGGALKELCDKADVRIEIISDTSAMAVKGLSKYIEGKRDN